jgi:hypothetical protein
MVIRLATDVELAVRVGEKEVQKHQTQPTKDTTGK